MENYFFGQYGNYIEFSCGADMLAKIQNINCSVPKRTAGRTAQHRERYCLKQYLVTLLRNNLLTFPFKITKCESPDFIIENNDKSLVGFEITEAATESHQKAMTDLERCPVGTILEMGTNALIPPGGKLTGEGWNGNAVEKEWADIVSDSIYKKTLKLNSNYFNKINEFLLLIYDNTHLSTMLHIEEVASFLQTTIRNKMAQSSFGKLYQQVSIIHSDVLLFDVTGKYLSLLGSKEQVQ